MDSDEFHDRIESLPQEIKFIRRLSEGEKRGDDILILRQDTAHKLLSDARRRVLRAIVEDDPESIRALSDHLNRPLSAVHRDVEMLYEADVIDYEDGPNNANRPVLAHDTILMEPMVFEGEMFTDPPANPYTTE